jgi:uncharacterized phage protein gp47/JayE
MPWTTPTLKEVRQQVRDAIAGSLPGADASVPNSVLRVISDAQGGLCHETLQYQDWLALQQLPDTAEREWLDRHGDIWLVNADGTTGRKHATLASGTASFQGIVDGAIIPANTALVSGASVPGDLNSFVAFETIDDITTSASAPVIGNIRAVDPGTIGNLPDGSSLTLYVPGVSSVVSIIHVTGGTDPETDDQLRSRILHRIQNPAMGGSQADYVTWALACAGVTRAWAAPEQGVGTITVRCLMDDLRASDDGWPTPADVQAVADYIDKMRPVTVKDCYVVAPIKEFIDITIANLEPDTAEVQAEVESAVRAMLFEKAAPGQTIYAAWVSYAIMSAPNITSFNLVTTADYVMPSLGNMAVLETILYQ